MSSALAIGPPIVTDAEFAAFCTTLILKTPLPLFVPLAAVALENVSTVKISLPIGAAIVSEQLRPVPDVVHSVDEALTSNVTGANAALVLSLLTSVTTTPFVVAAIVFAWRVKLAAVVLFGIVRLSRAAEVVPVEPPDDGMASGALSRALGGTVEELPPPPPPQAARMAIPASVPNAKIRFVSK